MKIGILTFCNTVNYGAELQAYALVEVFNRQKNVNAEIINYCNEAVYNSNRPKSYKEKATIIKKLKRFFAWRASKKRWDKFRTFENKYMHISAIEYYCDNVHEIKNNYDKFVIGSDQIWNLELNGCDITFFLPFIEDKDKIFTYAASFGYEAIPERYYLTTRNEILRIKHFLMREQSGVNIIKSLCDVEAEVVLDPTLLLEPADWNDFIIERKNSNPKYILLYLVDKDNNDMWEFITDFSEKNKLEIIWITPSRNLNKPGKKIRSAGPEEFMNLIYHAELVVTGSFHAVCFSLQYSKKFLYVMKDPNKASRITNLLELLDLKAAIFSSGQSSIVEIDYYKVQKRLQELREESIKKIEEICYGEIRNETV